jgi:hypothetical protein
MPAERQVRIPFELLHPVPIALSNISLAIIVAVKTIIASTDTSKIGQNHWLKKPVISSIPFLSCPVLLSAICNLEISKTP